MKKIIALMVGLTTLAFSLSAQDREHTLKVYNWADYIDESLIPEFEQWYKEQTGEDVKIIYQLFDVNEIMLSKIERGHEDFDVVCPSDYIIEKMLKSDLLLPIDKDFGSTPNYIGQNVSPFIKKMFENVNGGGKDANDYAVGYMWGTTGLMYNTKYISKEEASTWGAIADPRYKGKVFMKDAFRDVYIPILVYLKRDDIKAGKVTIEQLSYDTSDESIAMVENYLKSIKDNIAGWEADFGKEQMTKEKGWLNFTWSGDAQWAKEEAAKVGVSLDYEVPQEGSVVWFDGWVIPKYAKNVKAARYFINYMCKPENAIRNMDVIGYVSVIGGPQILGHMQDSTEFEPLDASYFFGPEDTAVCINPIMYPDKSVIERCGMMHDTGDRTEALLAMWSQVKGDNANYLTYIIIAAFIVILLAVYFISKNSKKRRRKNRRQQQHKK
jgi:spermidine/putrescine transport system substrate-binding protein